MIFLCIEVEKASNRERDIIKEVERHNHNCEKKKRTTGPRAQTQNG